MENPRSNIPLSLKAWFDNFVKENGREPNDDDTFEYFKGMLTEKFAPIKDSIQHTEDRIIFNGNGIYLNANREHFEEVLKEVNKKYE